MSASKNKPMYITEPNSFSRLLLEIDSESEWPLTNSFDVDSYKKDRSHTWGRQIGIFYLVIGLSSRIVILIGLYKKK